MSFHLRPRRGETEPSALCTLSERFREESYLPGDEPIWLYRRFRNTCQARSEPYRNRADRGSRIIKLLDLTATDER